MANNSAQTNTDWYRIGLSLDPAPIPRTFPSAHQERSQDRSDFAYADPLYYHPGASKDGSTAAAVRTSNDNSQSSQHNITVQQSDGGSSYVGGSRQQTPGFGSGSDPKRPWQKPITPASELHPSSALESAPSASIMRLRGLRQLEEKIRLLEEDIDQMYQTPSQSHRLVSPSLSDLLERAQVVTEKHKTLPPVGGRTNSDRGPDALRKRKPVPPRPVMAKTSSLASAGESRANTRTHTCDTCAFELPWTGFTHSHLTAACDHDILSCTECTQQFIETQLNDQGWDRIRCIGCKNLLQYDDVRRHATPAVFQRYDNLATRAAYSSIPDFMWCPRGCGSGQVHPDGQAEPLFRCHSCNQRWCIQHKIPWHQSETCRAYDRRMRGEPPIEEAQRMSPRIARRLGIELPPEPSRPAVRNDRLARPRQSQSDLDADEDIARALQLSLNQDERGARPKTRLRDMLKPSSRRHDRRTVERHRGDHHLASSYASSSNLRSDASVARRLQKQFDKEEEERKEYQARQERAEEERQGEATVKSIAKPCPRCRWHIQQDGGCDHMTCSKCSHQFCWLCLGDYDRVRRRGDISHRCRYV